MSVSTSKTDPAQQATLKPLAVPASFTCQNALFECHDVFRNDYKGVYVNTVVFVPNSGSADQIPLLRGEDIPKIKQELPPNAGPGSDGLTEHWTLPSVFCKTGMNRYVSLVSHARTTVGTTTGIGRENVTLLDENAGLLPVMMEAQGVNVVVATVLMKVGGHLVDKLFDMQENGDMLMTVLS